MLLCLDCWFARFGLGYLACIIVADLWVMLRLVLCVLCTLVSVVDGLRCGRAAAWLF